MFKIKVSTEFVVIIVIVAILALWFIAPIFSLETHEEKAAQDYHDLRAQQFERSELLNHSVELLNVADEALLKCIKNAVNEQAKIVTESGGIASIQELKHLYCPRQSIKSLIGIEHLTGLQFLNVSRNNIEDVSLLVELSELKVVNLLGNPLQDITPLKKMSLLEKVLLPQLRDIPCSQIREIVGHIENNIEKTGCRDERHSRPENKESQQEKSQLRSERLTREQEEELMNYRYRSRNDL